MKEQERLEKGNCGEEVSVMEAEWGRGSEIFFAF
jgi:hypothetical protein